MLYAKVIYSGVAEHTSASDTVTFLCGDRFDCMLNEAGEPIMHVHIGNRTEVVHLYGDVWITNESGKTVGQYAVPFSVLKKNAQGEANAHVELETPSVPARADH